MDLGALRIFVKVAELASFTRAAEHLGMTKPRVSTGVQQLESQLGTRLLHRTTRTVRMTPDGEQFFERARELLADADELQTLFERSPSVLRGRLRVDLPNTFARSFVIPRLPEFLAAHPQLEIELSSTDRRVDLVHEGFDCVVRVGALPDSGLVARRLGELRLINCASPAYVREHGMPRTLEDLAHHRLVHYTQALGAAPAGFEYFDGERTRFAPMRGVITVNNTDSYQAACLAGLGLIQAPEVGMRASVAEGQVVEVMPEFRAVPMPVSLLYPNRRNLSKRVQAFMNWLAEVLEPQLTHWLTEPGGPARG
jgi:DNA-binding transcriptional LysR family regulator